MFVGWLKTHSSVAEGVFAPAMPAIDTHPIIIMNRITIT
jgi:hypothetical protein